MAIIGRQRMLSYLLKYDSNLSVINNVLTIVEQIIWIVGGGLIYYITSFVLIYYLYNSKHFDLICELNYQKYSIDCR